MPHRFAVLALASLAVGSAAGQSAAAGSRAEEEANRPLRLIIEAAKIKPKARPVEAAIRPAAVPARAAPPQADPPASPPAPIVVVPSDPAAPPESTVATVEVQATPREPEPQPVPPALAEPEVPPEPAAALPPLKLRSLVEPVTPRHLAGRLRGEVRVEVALNVAADGSVSEASVTASSHPQMNAAVLEAVRQWRYEPAGRAREHAVQVVMRPDS